MLTLVATRPGTGTWRAEVAAARSDTSPVLCLPRSLEDLNPAGGSHDALVDQLVHYVPQLKPFLAPEMFTELREAVAGLLPYYTAAWNLALEVSLGFTAALAPLRPADDPHGLSPGDRLHAERAQELIQRLNSRVLAGATPGMLLAELGRELGIWPDLDWNLLISLGRVSREARPWLEEGLRSLARGSCRVRLVVDYPTALWLEELLNTRARYHRIDSGWVEGDDLRFVVTGGQPRLAEVLAVNPAPLAAPSLDEARAELRHTLSSSDDPRLRALQSCYQQELHWLLSDEYAAERERLLKIGLHPIESEGLPSGMGAEKDPIDERLVKAGLLVPWLSCPEGQDTVDVSGLRLSARRLLERCRHRFGWLEREEDRDDAQQLVARGLVARRLVVPDAPMLDFLTGHLEVTMAEFSNSADRPLQVEMRVAGHCTTHALTRQEMVVFLLLLHRATRHRSSLSKGQIHFAMMYILTRLAEVNGGSYLQTPPQLARLIVMLMGRFADVSRFGEHVIRPWQGERHSHYGLIGVRVLPSTRLFDKLEQLFDDGRGLIDFDHIFALYDELRRPDAQLEVFECTHERNRHCLTLRYKSWYVVITPQQVPARKARFQAFGQELVRDSFQLPDSICPELEWSE